MKRVLVFGLLILHVLALGCRSAPARLPDPREITLETPGIPPTQAVLYLAAVPQPPGLILVPSLGQQPRVWDTFARRAQGAGMTCIAMGMLPIDDSPADVIDSTPESTTFEAGQMAFMDVARAVLVERGVYQDDIVLIGAGLGANLALNYAATHRDIAALVLLSPGIESHGVPSEQAMVDYGKRPVLIMTCVSDSYAASSSRILKDKAIGFSELREYSGTAHGTGILDSYTQPHSQILLWLSRIVGPATREKK